GPFQRFAIGLIIPHGNGSASSHDPMAVRSISSLDARRLNRDNGSIEQGQQPAHRPRKPDGRLIPFHRFGEGELPYQLREQLQQDRFWRSARILFYGEQILPFGGGSHLQTFHGQPLTSGKSDRSLCRLSLLIKSHGLGGAHDLFPDSLLMQGKVFHDEDEPSRRAVGRNRS